MIKKYKSPLKLFAIRLFDRNRPRYTCPNCGYQGWFFTINNHDTGPRAGGKCPRCGAKERHRLIKLIFAELGERTDLSSKSVLHIAPENHITDFLQPRVKSYKTSSYPDGDTDFNFDITDIDLPDESFDIVLASHVLEHVPDDTKAMQEIKRILRPAGFAVMPVPICAESTIEYGRPLESGGHMRAPGPDYFNKLQSIFGNVEVFDSSRYSEKYQLYIYENRSNWPTKDAPLLQPMEGDRFMEYIPVCRKED